MFLRVTLVLCLCLVPANGFEDKSIAQWLTDNGYTTLVNLLKQAGLYDTLNGPGAYTVFAPSNAAFGKLSQSTLNKVAGDNATLENVLKNHIMQGFVLTPLMRDGVTKQSLNGQDLVFHRFGNGTMTVQGASVDSRLYDIILNNGVVHVLNSVTLPPMNKIGEILLNRDTEFSNLNMLLYITGLEPALLSGKLTLFAPTNAAFKAITTRLPDFTAPGALNVYKQILLNHVVNTTVLSGDLKDGRTITTLDGKTLQIKRDAQGVSISPAGSSITAMVTEQDVKAQNGVMHVVDQVLIPSGIRRRRLTDRNA